MSAPRRWCGARLRRRERLWDGQTHPVSASGPGSPLLYSPLLTRNQTNSALSARPPSPAQGFSDRRQKPISRSKRPSVRKWSMVPACTYPSERAHIGACSHPAWAGCVRQTPLSPVRTFWTGAAHCRGPTLPEPGWPKGENPPIHGVPTPPCIVPRRRARTFVQALCGCEYRSPPTGSRQNE
jgi:hypothetical protein